jgi:rare lipoprotein A
MNRALIFVLAAVLAITGCARKKHARTVPLPPAPGAAPVAAPIGWTETGIASWYGHPYHGRPAANGEIYDMEKLTAAHRTLPFETWLRVENLDNGKTVEVRVNDRGPFVDNRIIDLSHAAARNIAMIGPGTAKVRIEVIQTPPGEVTARFAVQVGAYKDRGNADRIRRDLEKEFGAAQIVLRDGKPPVWRVLVGSEPSQDAAQVLAGRIRAYTSEGRYAFVVRLDL